MLVEHSNPQPIKAVGELLVGRHQVGKEADEQRALVVYLENPRCLSVLQTGVDGHVQVMRVLHLDLLQLLQKLGIFLAFSDDVGRGVALQAQDLIREIHPRTLGLYKYAIIIQRETRIKQSASQQIDSIPSENPHNDGLPAATSPAENDSSI